MLALIMALGVTSIPAAAQDDAQPQEKAEKKKKEKKVCRTEKITGSLTRVNRICLTQAEWDEVAARTKKGVDELVGGAGGGTNSAWDPTNQPGVGNN